MIDPSEPLIQIGKIILSGEGIDLALFKKTIIDFCGFEGSVTIKDENWQHLYEIYAGVRAVVPMKIVPDFVKYFDMYMTEIKAEKN